MSKHIITKDQLQAWIDAGGERAERVVGRALIVLFERQTEHEKKVNTTDVDNGIGFTGADGKSGVISAKSFLKHGKFSQPWQLEQWTKKNAKGYSRITKYWKQLDQAAQQKKAKTC